MQIQMKLPNTDNGVTPRGLSIREDFLWLMFETVINGASAEIKKPKLATNYVAVSYRTFELYEMIQT